MAKFQVGDVVQLKGGSPPMTVVKVVEGAGLETLYFDREPAILDGKPVAVYRAAHTVSDLSPDAVELVPQNVRLAS